MRVCDKLQGVSTPNQTPPHHFFFGFQLRFPSIPSHPSHPKFRKYSLLNQHNYGKSPFLMDKPTVNEPTPINKPNMKHDPLEPQSSAVASGVGSPPRALSVRPPVHPWRPVARCPRSVDRDELLPVPVVAVSSHFLRLKWPLW